MTWQKVNENVDIDGYQILWKVKRKGSSYQRETLQNNFSTKYFISRLQNSTRYSVRVLVFKKSLKGPVSETVHQWTSNEPVSLKMGVSRNDSESMIVTWERLWRKNSGEDTLKSYTVSDIPIF